MIELSFEHFGGDIYEIDIDLPGDLMTRLLWWIEAHEYALTV